MLLQRLGPRYGEVLVEYRALLGTIFQQLAASGEVEVLRERHARYYLARLEALPAHAPWGTLMDRIGAERSNLAATAA